MPLERSKIDSVFRGIREHDFSRASGYTGMGDLADESWLVNMRAMRDIARLGTEAIPSLLEALSDPNPLVVHLSIKFLGYHQEQKAVDPLIDILNSKDEVEVHRQLNQCEAANALAQIGDERALPSLEVFAAETDKGNDLFNRAKVAVKLIKLRREPAQKILTELAGIDESRFHQLQIGRRAPGFRLRDHNGIERNLEDYFGHPILIVWIFAEWCGVCHNEFHELRAMQAEYQTAGVEVFTIQGHDVNRIKIMAQMHDPWWSHLADPANIVGASYGVDPMAYTVHSEWVNRPSTVIIDKQGAVRFAYYGTFWGDRPTIEETFSMIENDSYEFRHPDRLEKGEFRDS